MRRRFSTTALGAACAALLATAAASAPGDLDPAFGTGGRVVLPIGSGWARASDVALQPDGKIVVAGARGITLLGDFALARFGPAGALDASFGTAGTLVTGFGGIEAFSTAADVAVLPDGRLLAAGSTNATGDGFRFALARYDAAGGLDGSFGEGGRVVAAFPTAASASALVVLGDGRFVVAGQGGTGHDFALARFTPGGRADPGFGESGVVLTELADAGGARTDRVTALAAETGGELVAAGSSAVENRSELAVARYGADGALDAAFGSGGRVLTRLGGETAAAADVAIDARGRILVAGSLTRGVGADFVLARFTPDGRLDRSFGRSGVATTDIRGDDAAAALALLPDGRIVVAGTAGLPEGDVAVARYTARGSLDHSFGGVGYVTTDVAGSGAETAVALVVDAEGRALVAATHGSDVNFARIALVRYLGGGGLAGRLRVASFSTSPRPPRAGRRFTAALRAEREGASEPLAGARVSCTARAGRRSLRAIARGVRGETSFCSWRIPLSARRTTLRGSIALASTGGVVRRRFERRVH